MSTPTNTLGAGIGLSPHQLVLSSRNAFSKPLEGHQRLNHFTNQPPLGACPCQRSQVPNHGGWQHPPGHLSDRGTEPCPPRRATSPDDHTSELPNKVKGVVGPVTWGFASDMTMLFHMLFHILPSRVGVKRQGICPLSAYAEVISWFLLLTCEWIR